MTVSATTTSPCLNTSKWFPVVQNPWSGSEGLAWSPLTLCPYHSVPWTLHSNHTGLYLVPILFLLRLTTGLLHIWFLQPRNLSASVFTFEIFSLPLYSLTGLFLCYRCSGTKYLSLYTFQRVCYICEVFDQDLPPLGFFEGSVHLCSDSPRYLWPLAWCLVLRKCSVICVAWLDE